MTAHPIATDEATEWLETDGQGGFAMGTTGGIRTRRYHGWLVSAPRSPRQRFMMVPGADVFVEIDGCRHAISSHRYSPGVIHPDGVARLVEFSDQPWPTWRYRVAGLDIVQQLMVTRGSATHSPVVAVTWQAKSAPPRARLLVRPFLACRDIHALQRQNSQFRFETSQSPGQTTWRPYAETPGLRAVSNGAYRHDPDWYRQFHYQEESNRGYEAEEDLAAPGWFEFSLVGEAVLIVAAFTEASDSPTSHGSDPVAWLQQIRQQERDRRAVYASDLERAADAYVVHHGHHTTIMAGYPWFTDWGRDTFISLRGMCIASGRLDVARDILVSWSQHIVDGLLPNLFPDGLAEPAYNAIDASLWFVIAVHELLRASDAAGAEPIDSDRTLLLAAVETIVTACSAGTRYHIHADQDGLLACGEPGVQLTWMDAKIGKHVVTPRIGKPVEVQALWINALHIASLRVANLGHLARLAEQAEATFRARFWHCSEDGLFDVIDVDHQAGRVDRSVRPNQIFAVGGLPFALLGGARARQVVDVVEQRLWTPRGLRTLAPDDPAYHGRYEGGPESRDHAYHQGTAWPWLLGSFVEAWIRVRGSTHAAKQEARRRFLQPWLHSNPVPGLGHVSEIADGDAPHTPRGCPFQAWSVAEAMRMEIACQS